MNRNSLQHFGLIVLLAVTAVILAPSSAFAHTGISPAHDLLHGLLHPLTGLDHLLAMFAVGLWATQRGGRAIWVVPLIFLLVMTLGAVLGMSDVSLPLVESGVAISVLLLGLIVAAAVKLPVSVTAAIVGIFALLHGQAHGAEIPATASVLMYAVGFVATTIVLHATGISFGLASQRRYTSRIARYAGAAIAMCGLFICIR
jgi:urease accessory protein